MKHAARLAITALCLAAGCKVGPNYKRPPAPTPNTYKAVKGWKVAQPRDALSRGKWWTLFNDPALNALAEKVQISNQNLMLAEAQFRQSRALVRAARSQLWPTIAVSADVTQAYRASGSPLLASAAGGGASTTAQGGVPPTGVTFFSLPVDLTWEIDIWGRIRRNIEANEAAAQASAADLESAKLSAQTQLAQTYFQLRSFDLQRRIVEDTVKHFEKVLELTQNQYQEGVASLVNVFQAEAQLEATKTQAIELMLLRTQLENAIAVLTGVPASTFALAEAPLPAAPPEVPLTVPSEILERRPDVAAAERRMAAANARIGVATAAYFPTLSLSATGGFIAPKITDWLTWPSRFWSVGPSLAAPLFTGGLRGAQVDQAEAAYDAAVAFYRQTALTAFQEVEDNLAALKLLGEEAATQERAVIASKRAVGFAENQFQQGTNNYINLLITQNTLLSNQRIAADIQGRRMIAAVLLIRAIGGGWNEQRLPTNKEAREK